MTAVGNYLIDARFGHSMRTLIIANVSAFLASH
jgi:hypothetical protein